MAHPLHPARLREGTETWNSWRHTHPAVVADVSEAHLTHLTFDHIHLFGATFIGVDLSQATLHGADLTGQTFTMHAFGPLISLEHSTTKPPFAGLVCKQSTQGDINVQAARLV